MSPRFHPSRVAQLGWGVAATALAVGLTAGPALAHADPDVLVPSPCSVTSPPTEIVVVFGEELGPDSTGTVSDDAGVVIAALVVDLDDLDRRTVRAVSSSSGPTTGEPVGLPRLPTGNYQVTWEVASALDDDLTTGSYGFSVGQTASAADCALQTDEASSSGLHPAVLGGAALSFVAALGLLGRRRERVS